MNLGFWPSRACERSGLIAAKLSSVALSRPKLGVLGDRPLVACQATRETSPYHPHHDP